MSKIEAYTRPREYFIGTLVGIVVGISSLGVALLMNLPPLPVDRLSGAVWAWGVGAATQIWIMPWVKQAFVGGDGE